VNVRIESRLMTAPLAQVQKVITGQQIAARLSARPRSSTRTRSRGGR